MADKAERIITELFERLYPGAQAPSAELHPLPYRWAAGEEGTEPHRVVCDYIAGMTDRFSLDEYRKLFDPMEKV